MARQRSKKPLIFIVVLASIGLLVGLFLLFNSGNTAQITETPSRASVRQPALATYDGAYIRFQHKSTYQAERRTPGSDDLELAVLSANTNYEKRLAVAVSKLPGGKLAAHSGWLLRQSDPAYTQRQLATSAGTAYVWIKQDQTEQTVFIPRGNQVAVLSFTTVGTVDDLASELKALVNTLSWKAAP